MNVVLGVGGGIAAYKAAELSRALQDRGCAVSTVMTRAAQEFIQPLTFAALTGRKVITGLFDKSSADAILSSSVEHIAVARENQLLVVAPATADLLAQFAHGHASDFLTTLYLAFTGPVVLAPAMNTNMWNHPATQANLAILKARANHVIVEPGSGHLACGMTGPGRLAEPPSIADAVLAALHPRHDLAGHTILLTAGPTREAIDPVRYVSNHSSGKMGYALAEAAAARGARVILVSGPVALAAPKGVEMIAVESAREMYEAVMARLDEATIVIKSAAVADYSPIAAGQKIKKSGELMHLDLHPTRDILAAVGERKGARKLVGFAAETNDLLTYARRKLEQKNCDLIVANLVNQPGTGFGADENEVTLVTRAGDQPLGRASKRALADQILDAVVALP